MATSSSKEGEGVPEPVRQLAHDFLTLHQKSLVPSAADLTAEAFQRHRGSVLSMFLEWCQRFRVTPWPDRDAAVARLRAQVPVATEIDVHLAVVCAEMKGFGETDARRALERQHGITRQRGSSLIASNSPPPPSAEVSRRSETAVGGPEAANTPLGSAAARVQRRDSPLRRTFPRPPQEGTAPSDALLQRNNSTPSKLVPAADPLAEEVRDWLLELTPQSIRRELKEASNVVDALRDGVILSVVAQKLRKPDLADDQLRLPKRVDGFFARDNVAAFLKAIRAEYPHIPEALMLAGCDLCDGKNDRAVINFLLNLARFAVKDGYCGPLPLLLRLEAEVDAQAAKVSDAEVERLVREDLEIAEPVPPTTVSQKQAALRGSHSSIALGAAAPPPVTVLSLARSSLPEPQRPVDRVISKRDITSAVDEMVRNDTPAAVVYRPRQGDFIDEYVGSIVNRSVYFAAAHGSTRIKRLPHSGAYVVYHRITGKRTVVHVRVVRTTLMMRVGGGWEVFEDWLSRHAVDLA